MCHCSASVTPKLDNYLHVMSYTTNSHCNNQRQKGPWRSVFQKLKNYANEPVCLVPLITRVYNKKKIEKAIDITFEAEYDQSTATF